MNKAIRIFAILIPILTAATANANITHSLQHFLANQTSFRVSQDNPSPVPVRQASLKIQIQKVSYAQKPDGSYDSTTTMVCTKLATLNVYDLRDSSSSSINLPTSDYYRVTCNSDSGGQPVTVGIGGFIGLVKQSLFGDGHVDELKIAVPFLWVMKGTPQTISDFNAAALGTRDLNARSFLTVVQPPVSAESSCSADQNGNQSCQVSMNDYFTAVVDIQDRP